MNISILGAGSWGTTLAELAANNWHAVKIWAREIESCDEINQKHTLEAFTGDYALNPEIKAYSDLEDVLTDAELVVLAVPSKAVPEVLLELKTCIPAAAMILNVAKGLIPETHQPISELLDELFAKHDYGVLSGPNLALEILAGQPAATVVASRSEKVIQAGFNAFTSNTFRVYGNHDVKGVELGGIAKNVIAIASGIADGLGFGANTKATLLTRGLTEMERIAVFYGAKPETMLGLAGMGDLIATGFSEKSRNFRFGRLIAEGHSPKEALGIIQQTVEGLATTRILYEKSKAHELDLPIIEAVYRIIEEGSTPEHELNALMGRRSKYEEDV